MTIISSNHEQTGLLHKYAERSNIIVYAFCLRREKVKIPLCPFEKKLCSSRGESIEGAHQALMFQMVQLAGGCMAAFVQKPISNSHKWAIFPTIRK